MQRIKPIVLKPSFYARLERELKEYFYSVIYEPLWLDVKDEIGKDWVRLENATESDQEHLLKRLSTGRIQYTDGRFYGDFDSKTTKALKALGATYDARGKFFHLNQKKLTDDMRIAIGTAFSKFQTVHKKIITRLDNLEAMADSGNLDILDTSGGIRHALASMEQEAKGGLNGVGISPREFSPSLSNFIMERYGEDLQKYIKGWTIESIQRLRSRVLANAFTGYRASGLVEEIQADYGVSERKAQFLARQETSLVLSTYREGRYKDEGITEYEWQTAGDSRVRTVHQHLNHKIFTWDNPPIIDEMGHRGTPGESFNCRCVACPIIR